MRRFIARCFTQPLYRQLRGMTLGTRSLVLNGQSQIMLIQHTYARGWSLPGGGVERGETLAQSAIREIREEAGIIAKAEPELRGICLNDAQFKGDHVAIFVLRDFERGPWQPDWEISAAQFFSVEDLPEGTTPGTRRRLAEILNHQAPAARW